MSNDPQMLKALEQVREQSGGGAAEAILQQMWEKPHLLTAKQMLQIQRDLGAEPVLKIDGSRVTLEKPTASIKAMDHDHGLIPGSQHSEPVLRDTEAARPALAARLGLISLTIISCALLLLWRRCSGAARDQTRRVPRHYAWQRRRAKAVVHRSGASGAASGTASGGGDDGDVRILHWWSRHAVPYIAGVSALMGGASVYAALTGDCYSLPGSVFAIVKFWWGRSFGPSNAPPCSPPFSYTFPPTPFSHSLTLHSPLYSLSSPRWAGLRLLMWRPSRVERFLHRAGMRSLIIYTLATNALMFVVMLNWAKTSAPAGRSFGFCRASVYDDEGDGCVARAIDRNFLLVMAEQAMGAHLVAAETYPLLQLTCHAQQRGRRLQATNMDTEARLESRLESICARHGSHAALRGWFAVLAFIGSMEAIVLSLVSALHPRPLRYSLLSAAVWGASFGGTLWVLSWWWGERIWKVLHTLVVERSHLPEAPIGLFCISASLSLSLSRFLTPLSFGPTLKSLVQT